MKQPVTIDRVNGAAGLLFIGFGLFFGIQAWMMPLGTAFRMGPGYFPFVLSGILILLGGVIIASAVRTESEGIGRIAWRGMFFILAAPVLFGLLLRGLGFVPAIFVAALVASFASSKIRPLHALALSAALAAFSTATFIYGLGLPLRLVGPWLGGY